MPVGNPSVLERKLGRRSSGRAPLNNIELVGEHFGQRLEDELSALLGSDTEALILGSEVGKLSDAIKQVPAPAMLGLVHVDSTDGAAFIHFSPDLVYHVVDLRMSGDPKFSAAPVERAFTRIDSQLCLDVFDAIIRSLMHGLEVVYGAPPGTGMTITGAQHDIGNLRIAAKNADVLSLSVSLEFGTGGRTGSFEFVLPLSILDALRPETPNPGVPVHRPPNDPWQAQMRKSAAAAAVPVHAVLHRQKMTLAAAQKLAIGDVITIPKQSIQDIEIVLALGTDLEASIASGRLGGFEGAKVIKLSDPPTAEFQSGLKQMISG